MRKLLCTLVTAATLQAGGQTLATVGGDTITVTDFLYAYRKNSAAEGSTRNMRDYLQLYIDAKLKVKEALARGLDTSAQFRADLQGLRAQVMPAYLNDPQAVERLTREAFTRAQRDLQVGHIFIPLPRTADTAAAYQQAAAALAQLRSGTPFAQVAARYSVDTAAASNGGSLGYITAFSLPYELESLAYQTPVGGLSPLYRSAAGYHIFKVYASRPALGRMQAAQILLAFPPGAGATEQRNMRRLADSLYRRLQQGADFGTLASQYSQDALSAGAGGLLPEFGVGRFDPVFEQQAFSLPRDGAITAPFATSYGLHILKRIKRIPAATKATPEVLQQLRSVVQQNDRIENARRQQLRHVLQQAGYKPLPAALYAALQARTRAAFNGTASADELPAGTVLLRLGSDSVTVTQWLDHARANRFAPDGSERSFNQLWDNFVETRAQAHYQQNLEFYNPDFRRQVAELREGNLFFEIMQQEVWNKAQNDTAALRHYYEQHRQQYRWQRSADAVVFYAGSAATARQLAAQVQKSPAQWRTLATQFGENVSADSTHLEWSSLPGGKQLPFKKSQVTRPEVNTADGSASFAYILQVYDRPEQRSFEAARGAVISDYQQHREQEWVKSLRSKYTVQVNEAVLQGIKE